jgi:hypothetical protein
MNPDGELNTGLIERYHKILAANGVSGAFITAQPARVYQQQMEEKLLVAEAGPEQSSGGTIRVINHPEVPVTGIVSSLQPNQKRWVCMRFR